MTAVLCAGATAPGPALAQDSWLTREVSRLSALPHTLDAAEHNSWFQIPVKDQRDHGVSKEAYKAVRSRLDTVADAARPDLEHELDAELGKLSYAGLEAKVRQHQPSPHCGRFWAVRWDGEIPAPSDLQATLLVHCRRVTADVVVRLLEEHAEAIDLRLQALPGAELRFPRGLLADLASPDASGARALDPARVQASYQDHVARRVTAALPGIRQELELDYANRTWTGGALTSPAAACSAQLGPLFAGELASFCQDVATRRLLGVLPSMQQAIPTTVRAILDQKPTLTQIEICGLLRARWLPGDGYPATMRDTIMRTCLAEADRAIEEAKQERARSIDQAINDRVASLAAPLLTAPRTFDSLLAHSWFAQPATSWDGIVPASDADATSVKTTAQARFAEKIAPATAAAVGDARIRIEHAYHEAAGSAAAMPETRRLCGPDGQGGGLPPARGEQETRNQIVSICVEAYKAFTQRRVQTALERAGIKPDDPTLLLLPVDDTVGRIRLAELVARAAVAGLQARLLTGPLQLVLSPMGVEVPALIGALTRTSTGIQVDRLDAFPGWPADPFDTVVCAMASEDDLASDQFIALLTVFGSLVAIDNDRPRAAGYRMRQGLTRLQEVQSLRACLAAREAFINQAARR